MIAATRTLDQAKALRTCIEVIAEKTLRTTVAITAGRGRVSPQATRVPCPVRSFVRSFVRSLEFLSFGINLHSLGHATTDIAGAIAGQVCGARFIDCCRRRVRIQQHLPDRPGS